MRSSVVRWRVWTVTCFFCGQSENHTNAKNLFFKIALIELTAEVLKCNFKMPVGQWKESQFTAKVIPGLPGSPWSYSTLLDTCSCWWPTLWTPQHGGYEFHIVVSQSASCVLLCCSLPAMQQPIKLTGYIFEKKKKLSVSRSMRLSRWNKVNVPSNLIVYHIWGCCDSCYQTHSLAAAVDPCFWSFD